MGRPERALDPASGPIAEFALQLRRLRHEAGSPSYRELARRTRFAASVLSNAAGGSILPTLAVTLAFVRACDGDLAAWEHLWRSVAATRPGPRPPSSAPLLALAQLPPRPADLTGRAAAMGAMRDLLAGRQPTDASAVHVHGPVGVGKTAFVTDLAQRLRRHWPDGQLYADLSTRTPPGEVLGWFVRSLGTPPDQVPGSTDERSALYRSLLSERQVLVLLDGVEDERQVRPLLAPNGTALVLMAGRSRLAGLSAHRVALPGLADEDALALLEKLAGAARMAAEPAEAGRLVEFCEGLPLALWICGTRLAGHPDWTLAEVAESLADPWTRVGWLRVGDISLRGRLTSAYRGLNPDTRRYFRQLAVDGPGPFDPLDLQEALVDAGLLPPTGPALRLFRLFAKEMDQRAR